MHLLEVLREECGVVSAKNGCAPEGACGCCLVLIDGRPALSCLRKPEQMDGHDVVTLEGIPEETRRVIGEAFVLEGGVQCGFCIPGIVVRAASLIQQGKTDDRAAIAKALDGHCAAAPDTGGSSTRSKPPARPCRNGGTPAAQRAAAALLLRRRVRADAQSGVREAGRTATGNGHGHRHARRARLGGLEQTLGEKPFVDDMRVPGMLHGAMVLTEHPRAQGAEDSHRSGAAMPGVVRVFTAADVPGFRGTGLNDPDLPVFVAEGEIDLLRRRLSRDGRRRHAVSRAPGGRRRSRSTTRCSSRSPIRSRRSKPGAPLVHSADTFRPTASNVHRDVTAFSRGDVEAALGDAPRTSSRRRSRRSRSTSRSSSRKRAWPCRRGTASRFTPRARDRCFDHTQIAKVLNLAADDVEIALAASGGAFGAKEELSIQAQTAMAALPAGPAGEDRAHARAVDAAPRQAPPDDDRAHGRRRRRRASAGAAVADRRRCRRLRTARAPSALLRAACHSCGAVPRRRTSTSNRRPSTPTTRTSGAMRGFGSNQAQFAHGRRDGHPRREGRRRRLGHPRAEHPQPRRRVRDRPDHARERPRHARVARGRQGRLQEREIQGHRLRHQEHRASATAPSRAATSRSACVDGSARLSRSSTATRRWARASTRRRCRRCARRPACPPTS